MIKQLLATVVTSAALLAGAPAASAAPTSCWIDTSNTQDVLTEQVCDASIRTNYNGHQVVDLTDDQGTMISIILWKTRQGNPMYAEVFTQEGNRLIWHWAIDNEGDVYLYDKKSGFEIWFTWPNIQQAPVRTA